MPIPDKDISTTCVIDDKMVVLIYSNADNEWFLKFLYGVIFGIHIIAAYFLSSKKFVSFSICPWIYNNGITVISNSEYWKNSRYLYLISLDSQ